MCNDDDSGWTCAPCAHLGNDGKHLLPLGCVLSALGSHLLVHALQLGGQLLAHCCAALQMDNNKIVSTITSQKQNVIPSPPPSPPVKPSPTPTHQPRWQGGRRGAGGCHRKNGKGQGEFGESDKVRWKVDEQDIIC